MATIDTSTIENFDNMTAEEKVTALLGIEIPEQVDLSGKIDKSVFDKTASELAEAKRQLKSRMSEEEQSKAQRDAEVQELQSKYDELLRKSTVSEHKAKFLAMGYEAELAEKAATALVDGDTAKLFEYQSTAMEQAAKRLTADLAKADPKPDGMGGKAKSEGEAAVELAKQIGKAKNNGSELRQKTIDYYKV